MISRYFPPIGGAGVHRTLGSVRYLPEHGYEPVLVTGPGQQRGRGDAHDDEMLERVPPSTEICRVVSNRARRAVFVPAPGGWALASTPGFAGG